MPSALAFVHAMLLHFQSLPFSAMYCNVKGKIDVSKHREEEGATFPTFETIMQASLFLIAVVSTALGKAQCKTIPIIMMCTVWRLGKCPFPKSGRKS